MAKQNGTCKWFNSEKGYGFITPADGSEDLFCHQSVIHAEGFRSLGEGEAVEFNVVTDERSGKLKAVDVTGPNGEFVKGAPRRTGGFGGAQGGAGGRGGYGGRDGGYGSRDGGFGGYSQGGYSQGGQGGGYGRPTGYSQGGRQGGYGGGQGGYGGQQGGYGQQW